MKYELIKKYPNSPELGTEVKEDFFGQYVTEDTYIYSKKDIEDYPEFWERVEEKDYEILSLMRDNHIYTKTKCGEIGCDRTQTYLSPEYDGVFIHSVKRLSDGEIFTIGDKYKNLSGTFTINGFTITPNNYMVVNADPFGSCGLDCIEKIKQPLFTTRDGVDIYERNKYWYVSTQGRRAFVIRTEIANNSSGKCSKHGVIYFSTKEKAKEYIEENKPRYSLKDVHEAVKNASSKHYGHVLTDSFWFNLK